MSSDEAPAVRSVELISQHLVQKPQHILVHHEVIAKIRDDDVYDFEISKSPNSPPKDNSLELTCENFDGNTLSESTLEINDSGEAVKKNLCTMLGDIHLTSPTKENSPKSHDLEVANDVQKCLVQEKSKKECNPNSNSNIERLREENISQQGYGEPFQFNFSSPVKVKRTSPLVRKQDQNINSSLEWTDNDEQLLQAANHHAFTEKEVSEVIGTIHSEQAYLEAMIKSSNEGANQIQIDKTPIAKINKKKRRSCSQVIMTYNTRWKRKKTDSKFSLTKKEIDFINEDNLRRTLEISASEYYEKVGPAIPTSGKLFHRFVNNNVYRNNVYG